MNEVQRARQVSVIIPTYNRRELLSQCLDRVFGQECDPNSFEVIVIVDGSQDGTVEMLGTKAPSCGFRFIIQDNAGQAAARNQGIRAAHGELILFLDDDILVPPNIIAKHVAVHRNFESAVVFGAIQVAADSRGGLATSYTDYFSKTFYGELENGADVRFPKHIHVLPNSSVARQALLTVGGFDENFFRAHEDTELGLRLWKQGFRFVFLSNTSCQQVFGKNAIDVGVLEAELDGRSEVLLCGKHSDYRHFSDLVPMSQLPHLFEEAMLEFPFTRGVSSTALRIAEVFSRSRFGSRVGRRLVSLSRRANLHQAASRVLGGNDTLRESYWKRLPVLMYHHVGPDAGLGTLTVSPVNFAAQMRWLRDAGFESITPSVWRSWCDEGTPLPKKPVVLTFDDGYADLDLHAFPILEKMKMKATVFLVSSEIGGTNRWDRNAGKRENSLLNSDQIRYWAQKGIDFGAHTRTHCDLSNCNEEELYSEIVGCADDIQSIVGSRPVSFAYPYGFFTPEAAAVVSRNFGAGFSVSDGRNHLGTDYYLLKRTMVLNSDSKSAFLCRLKVGRSPREIARSILFGPRSSATTIHSFATSQST